MNPDRDAARVPIESTGGDGSHRPPQASVPRPGRVQAAVRGLQAQASDLRDAARSLVALGAGLVTAVSATGRIGTGRWPFDLLANFRLQYTVLLLGAVALLAVLRSRRLTIVTGVVAAVHLISLAPLVIEPGQPDGPGPTLRVVQFNVLTSNARIDAASRWLADQDPEVIVAQETDQRWADGLTNGLVGWRPLPTDTVRSGNFGMLILVRDDVEVGVIEVIDRDLPAITVELPIDDRPPVLLTAVHTLPPVDAAQMETANGQLEVAAAAVVAHPGPSLLVGDLNATRWSGTYRRLIDRTGLRNAADGFGLGGTWPANLWYTGAIGIDHVLVSGEIRVEGWETGPDLGSDHRPVVTDLVITDG